MTRGHAKPALPGTTLARRLTASLIALLTAAVLAVIGTAGGLSLPWFVVVSAGSLGAAAAVGAAITGKTKHERVRALALLNFIGLCAICAIGVYSLTRPARPAPTGYITTPMTGAIAKWNDFQGTYRNLAANAELWLIDDATGQFLPFAPVSRYADGGWVVAKGQVLQSGPEKGSPVHVALVWTSNAATERRFYDIWGPNLSLEGLSVSYLQTHTIARATYTKRS